MHHNYIPLMLFFIAASSVLGVCILWAIYKVLVGIHEELQDLYSSVISKD
jgi:DMSO reductase anchor subunit